VEIITLQLENKYKKWQGENEVDFTLMKTCYLATLKCSGIDGNIAKIDQKFKISR
jgi:hypothetical protein